MSRTMPGSENQPGESVGTPWDESSQSGFRSRAQTPVPEKRSAHVHSSSSEEFKQQIGHLLRRHDIGCMAGREHLIAPSLRTRPGGKLLEEPQGRTIAISKGARQVRGFRVRDAYRLEEGLHGVG